VTGPAPKTVVDDKTLKATYKAADEEAVVHEQEIDEENHAKSVGGLKPENCVTVEFAGAPGVELRVKPEDLDEESRPKTSTDTGPISPRREPSVKVVSAPEKSDAKPASRACGK
jgi:hypothetical protein